MDFINHYHLLRIQRTASSDEIHTAFRKLALRVHPDKAEKDPVSQAKATERFQRVNEAHKVLMDPSRRAEFDRHMIAKYGPPDNQPQRCTAAGDRKRASEVVDLTGDSDGDEPKPKRHHRTRPPPTAKQAPPPKPQAPKPEAAPRPEARKAKPPRSKARKPKPIEVFMMVRCSTDSCGALLRGGTKTKLFFCVLCKQLTCTFCKNGTIGGKLPHVCETASPMPSEDPR